MRTANLVNNLRHLKFLLIARQSKDARNVASKERNAQIRHNTSTTYQVLTSLQQQANRESIQTESKWESCAHTQATGI